MKAYEIEGKTIFANSAEEAKGQFSPHLKVKELGTVDTSFLKNYNIPEWIKLEVVKRIDFLNAIQKDFSIISVCEYQYANAGTMKQKIFVKGYVEEKEFEKQLQVSLLYATIYAFSQPPFVHSSAKTYCVIKNGKTYFPKVSVNLENEKVSKNLKDVPESEMIKTLCPTCGRIKQYDSKSEHCTCPSTPAHGVHLCSCGCGRVSY